jgi:hypothetical protein
MEFPPICLQLTVRLDGARLARAISRVGWSNDEKPDFTRTIKELVRTYMVVERLVRWPLNNLTWLVSRQILLVFSKGQET